MLVRFVVIFFFKQKTAYELRISDWSSDVCSSDLLEEWKDTYFGSEALPADAAPKAGAKDAAEAKPVETSALDPRLPPEAQALARIEARQEAFSAHLLAAVDARALKARDAIAKLGLDPKTLVRKASVGQGGPFIPCRGPIGRASALGESFAALEGALFRMEGSEEHTSELQSLMRISYAV